MAPRNKTPNPYTVNGCKAGRAPKVTTELLEEVCGLLVEDKTLVEIAKKLKFDRSNFLRYILLPGNEEMFKMYMDARKAQALGWADDMIEISEGKTDYYNSENAAERVSRDSLKLRAKQWLASRIMSTVFGDRVAQEISGKDGGPVETKIMIDAPRPETYDEFKARKAKELNR